MPSSRIGLVEHEQAVLVRQAFADQAPAQRIGHAGAACARPVNDEALVTQALPP